MKNLKTITKAPSFEELRAFLQDLNLKSAEFDRQRIENERYLKEMFAETDKKFAETDRVLSEKFAETRLQMAETARRFKETERFIKEMSKNINGISNSNGEYAEDFFIDCFTKNPYFAQQEFHRVEPNLNPRDKKNNLEGEYDLVLINCTAVAIIEIKYKARKDYIEDLLKKPDSFKHFYPQYANYNFYLGIAGFTFESQVEAEAIKKGIAVIKQVGEKMVVNDKHLKVWKNALTS
jgi:hypothetical protein